MSMRQSHDRLQADLTSVETVLAALPAADPLGRLSLGGYRDVLIDALDDAAQQAPHAARVEITLGGEPVAGGRGVHAVFLADVVGGLQDLLSRMSGPRGSAHLFVTGLSHQPSGVILEELDEAGDLLFSSPLRHAVSAAIEYLGRIANASDADFADLIDTVEPRALKAARDFVGRICRNEGTFRIAQDETRVTLDGPALDRAWRRLAATHVDESPLKLTGRLLGIIPLGRRFEFRPDDGRPAISGRVGVDVSARYIAQLDGPALAGRRWTALLERVTVERPGQAPVERYTLLDLEPAIG